MTFERPNIERMQGYSYGEQPEDDQVVKLNTNENPYPPSPAVGEVLKQFEPHKLRRYPPALANDFRKSAAQLHKLNPENIIATRGGDELLRLLFTTFTDPGDIVAMTEPTYSLYPVLAQIQDVEVHKIEMNPDYSLIDDFAKRANAAGAKMTFVVNPHAPSGKLISSDEIRALAEQLDSLLLVDEAYVDFIDPARAYNCLDLAQSREDVIFLRSMSKGYGLAGLRFGYGIAHTSIIEPMLTKTRDSYNLDAISQALACAAVEDQTYAQNCWAKVRESRKTLTTALETRGFSVAPSEANFVLATVPHTQSADALYQQLRDRNVYVRYFSAPGMEDKLRISIGTEQENQTLLTQLDTIMSSGG